MKFRFLYISQLLESIAFIAATLLLVSGAHAQNLFVEDWGSGNIYIFTPDGAQGTFASGLSLPMGLAFNNSGDLFEADNGSGKIYRFTTNGPKSTFASGLSAPHEIAFNAVDELFVADYGSGNIFKFTHCRPV